MILALDVCQVFEKATKHLHRYWLGFFLRKYDAVICFTSKFGSTFGFFCISEQSLLNELHLKVKPVLLGGFDR